MGDNLLPYNGPALTGPKVTVLKPKPPEPTVAEEIVAALEGLAAAIKAGEVIPSHLVIGYGSRTVIDGEAATHYDWDAIGINTYEVIGHLSVYLTRLAMGEGE